MNNQNSRYGAIIKSLPMTFGKVFFVLNSTDTYGIAEFSHEFPVDSDGVPRVYIGTDETPIQAAIDACVGTRGDIVYIFGSFTITTPILVNKKGISVLGGNAKQTKMGGNTSITSAVNASAVFTVSVDDVVMSDIRMTCSSGTGTVIGIDLSGTALSNCVFRNMRILKSAGDDNAGIAIKAGSPTSCTFENLSIESTTAKEWASGLLIVAGTGLLVKDVYVNGVNATGITDATSTSCVYRELVIGNDVGVGTEITGTSSCIINSRNFAASEGTSTAVQANVLVNGE